MATAKNPTKPKILLSLTIEQKELIKLVYKPLANKVVYVNFYTDLRPGFFLIAKSLKDYRPS
jgi:hypothetical protein